jgi:hypothetical protein
MYWRVALLVLLIASVPHAKAEPPDEQALRLFNHYRETAELTPVKLDRQLSAGCMEHANYMVQNQGTDAMAGLNPHTQDGVAEVNGYDDNNAQTPYRVR